MIYYLIAILISFLIMILSIFNLNIPLCLISFSCMAISMILGIIFGERKKDKPNNSKKENIKPMPPPVKRTYKKYICNQKTLVFHRPSCSYLRGIDLDCLYSDEYIAYENDTKYSRLVELGYKPCKRCQPH